MIFRWQLLSAVLACGLVVAPAQAKDCKKGKKLCGNKCISAKKVCKDTAGPEAADGKKGQSASEAEVSAALRSQAGQAMLQLARALQKSGDLDPTDQQRAAFKQALRGMRTAPPVCDISHVQLVRDCDAVIKGTVTLPCYLSVDEMADVCKGLGHPMPQFK